MAKAIWNGVVIAETDKFEFVEGNIYFPPDSIKQEYFSETKTTSVCPWKGTANYFTLKVNGEELADAAWVYKTPKKAAEAIKDHVAFWRGVTVEN
jgi:uncharacterized protein (DUF427 family)